MQIKILIIFFSLFQILRGNEQNEITSMDNSMSIFVPGIVEFQLDQSNTLTTATTERPIDEPNNCEFTCASEVCPMPDYMQDPPAENPIDFPVCATNGLTYDSECIFNCLHVCITNLQKTPCHSPNTTPAGPGPDLTIVYEMQKDFVQYKTDTSVAIENLRIESDTKLSELKTKYNAKFDELKAESEFTEQTLLRKIDFIKMNPVPIGFTYVQLRDEPEPVVIWPQVIWTEVTSQYEGLFFRVAGGEAAPFGQIQGQSSPTLTNVQYYNSYSVVSLTITPGEWSKKIATAGSNGTTYGLSFLVSDVENRPKNTAMRIWKRTA